MSRFKQQCAVLFGMCVAQLGLAYHYPIYRSIKSTAYYPKAASKPLNNEHHAIDVNAEQTPYQFVINPLNVNQLKAWPFVFKNQGTQTIKNVSITAPNHLITNIDYGCAKQLQPGKTCHITLQFNLETIKHMTKQQIVFPITLTYKQGQHTYHQTHNVLLIKTRLKHFYHMPMHEYAEKHGIASNFLISLFLDKNNHLLVGSDSGLSMGDDQNKDFKLYNNIKHLDDDITAITKDPTGTIFVGTNHGLSISYDDGLSFIHKTSNNGLSGNRIRALYWKNHCLYIGTNFGLSISCDDGHTFKSRTLDNGLGSLTVNQIAADRLGHLWVATDNGLAVSNNNGIDFRNVTVNYGLGDNAVNGIAIDNDNHIYAATENGLSVSVDDGRTFKNYTTQQGLLSNRILSVLVDPDNKVYVGTDCGLSVMRHGVNTFYSEVHGCKANQAVNDMVIDYANHKLYMATHGHGLGERNLNTQATHFIETNAVADSFVNQFIMANNQLLIGTDVGLSISNDRGQTFKLWQPKEDGSNILSIINDHNKQYIGTTHGLYVLQDQRQVAHLFKDYQINSIALDTLKHQLMVGTPQGLLVSHDQGVHYIQHTVDDGLLEDNVTKLLIDPIKQILYVVTNHGLSYSLDDGQTFHAIHFNHILNYPMVSSFAITIRCYLCWYKSWFISRLLDEWPITLAYKNN